VLERRFAVAVLVAGAVGLVAASPGRSLVRHHLIPVLLFVLVLVSAVGIESGIARRLRGHLPQLAAVLAGSAVVGVLAAWLASRVVGNHDLRHGVLALGLAPTEIATVAMTGLAGGDAAIAAALLVASTGLTVLIAGPVLGVLAGSAVNASGTVTQLALVVGLPLVGGLCLRPLFRRAPPLAEAAAPLSIVLVLALVALVASQIRPSTAYVVVTAAIVGFLGVTTAAALVAGRLVDPSTRPAVVLSVAVRDFAVASGIASAAFGPKASGPLGIYGVLVIATGAALTRHLSVGRGTVP
jgi:predicted Na+-dependent transporter